MARARHTAIQQLAVDEGGALLHPMLLEQSGQRLAAIERLAAESTESYPKMLAHFTLQLQSIEEARRELIRMHRAGLIEDEVLHNLERDLDFEEMSMKFQMDT